MSLLSGKRLLFKAVCHRCQVRRSMLVACGDYSSPEKGRRSHCPGCFCLECVEQHFFEDARAIALLPEWRCFQCTGRCKCASCTKEPVVEETLAKADDSLLSSLPVLRRVRTKRHDDDSERRLKRSFSSLKILAACAEESLTLEERATEIEKLKKICESLQIQHDLAKQRK